MPTGRHVGGGTRRDDYQPATLSSGRQGVPVRLASASRTSDHKNQMINNRK
ncbi:hypothetical protein SAMN04488057_12231 [Cyclobacterium lianum]|uniref:Uncharacterized protein n=1 Tax=Cyclobacterium lianum TaxID=388280 RepID=A0A1M7QRP1_9BACT|nr:hypothetical protein SAMN04488057_12231 [Cyclobacterium lianum]